MYKQICAEVKAQTGVEITPYELAKLCNVQYGEVSSIFKQPIKLREMVLYFMYKKSGLAPAKFMAKLGQAVDKAIEEKLEAKIKNIKKKK